MQEECLFCKIIEGTIPCFVIYEDVHFKVILDRFPANKGHLLIIPKKHYKDIFELGQEEAELLYPLAKKLAMLLKDTFKAEGVNIVQNNGFVAGQTIYHFHLHVIPRYVDDEVVLNKTMNQDTTIVMLQEVANELIDALK